MQRKAGIRHLRTTAELCERTGRRDDGDHLLVAAYAFGPILEPVDQLDVVQVALVLDLPAADLTWGARPPSCQWLRYVLELDKRPVWASWRPAEWPVWNHQIRRPLRLWSDVDGVEVEALDALSEGTAESHRSVEPSRDERIEQYRVELDACREHLRTVRDRFWDREWRRDHKGGGDYPEQHLWNAADGYLEMLDAVRDLTA